MINAVEYVGGPLDGKSTSVEGWPGAILVPHQNGYDVVYNFRCLGKYQYAGVRYWKLYCCQCNAELNDAVVMTVRAGGPRVCGQCIDKVMRETRSGGGA